MKLLLFILIFFLNIDLKAQTEGYKDLVGYIEIGREYDEINLRMKDHCFRCYHNTICFVYYHFYGGIGRLKIIERIISISEHTESIYSSEEVDVDPNWLLYWKYITLPKGKYKIKIYGEEGDLMGFSPSFQIL